MRKHIFITGTLLGLSWNTIHSMPQHTHPYFRPFAIHQALSQSKSNDHWLTLESFKINETQLQNTFQNDAQRSTILGFLKNLLCEDGIADMKKILANPLVNHARINYALNLLWKKNTDPVWDMLAETLAGTTLHQHEAFDQLMGYSIIHQESFMPDDRHQQDMCSFTWTHRIYGNNLTPDLLLENKLCFLQALLVLRDPSVIQPKKDSISLDDYWKEILTATETGKRPWYLLSKKIASNKDVQNHTIWGYHGSQDIAADEQRIQAYKQSLQKTKPKTDIFYNASVSPFYCKNPKAYALWWRISEQGLNVGKDFDFSTAEKVASGCYRDISKQKGQVLVKQLERCDHDTLAAWMTELSFHRQPSVKRFLKTKLKNKG